MASRKVEVKLVGDASKLSGAFSKAGKDGDSFGRKLRGGVGGSFKTLALGAGLAGAAVVGGLAVGLTASVRAALESEESQKRLDAALKSVGSTSGTLRGQIDAANTSLSQMSGFDDEDLQNAFSDLVRTTGDAQGSLRNYGLVADLARAKNIPLAGAAKIVGRVMNGNTSVLKRYGIELEKGATSQDALAAMQKKFGGAAKAYGDTTAGSIDKAKVAFGNIKETIGGALLPVVASAATSFAGFASQAIPRVQAALSSVTAWISTNWPRIKEVLLSAWRGYVAYFHAVVEPMLRALVQAATRIVSYIVAHWPQIQATAIKVFQAVSAFVRSTFLPLAQAIIARARQVVAFIVAHWPQIRAVIGRVMQAIAPIVRTALAVVRSVIQAVTAAINGNWHAAWEHVKQALRQAWQLIVQIVRTAGPLLLQAAKAAGELALRGLRAALAAAPGVVRGLMSRAADAITSVNWSGIAASAGSAILSGFQSALSGLGSWLSGLVRDAINGLIDRANSAFTFSLDTHIPGVGRVSIGPPGIPHLAAGGVVSRPTLALIGEAGPEAVVPLSRAGDFGGGGGTTIIVNVAGSVRSDRDLTEVIVQELRRRVRYHGAIIPARSVRTT